MKKLTDKQILFLVENEDKYTLGEFAKEFNCSAKEVYQIYDKITKTDGYKEYVHNRALKITGLIEKGRKTREQIKRFNENRKNERKVDNRLPLIYVSNDTYDIFSSTTMYPYDNARDKQDIRDNNCVAN